MVAVVEVVVVVVLVVVVVVVVVVVAEVVVVEVVVMVVVVCLKSSSGGSSNSNISSIAKVVELVRAYICLFNEGLNNTRCMCCIGYAGEGNISRIHSSFR